MRRLLIANRGEIAIRVTEAAAELGLTTVAIFSEDDAKSLHVIRADEAYQLRGAGAASYLDGEQIVTVDIDVAPFDSSPNSTHGQEIPVRRLLVRRRVLFLFLAPG